MDGTRRRRRARDPIGPSPSAHASIVLRAAAAPDTAQLAQLAALDSQPLPAGPLLAAEVDGEIWAAVSLSGEAVIANPFRPTAALLELLLKRRTQLSAGRRGRAAVRRWPLAWLAGARDASAG